MPATRPVFVTSIDAARNEIVVGDKADLAVGGFIVDETSFVEESPVEGARVYVQHRAHGDVHRFRLALADFEALRRAQIYLAEHERVGKRALTVAANSVRVFTSLFGPLPFKQISIAEAPLVRHERHPGG